MEQGRVPGGDVGEEGPHEAQVLWVGKSWVNQESGHPGPGPLPAIQSPSHPLPPRRLSP